MSGCSGKKRERERKSRASLILIRARSGAKYTGERRYRCVGRWWKLGGRFLRAEVLRSVGARFSTNEFETKFIRRFLGFYIVGCSI